VTEPAPLVVPLSEAVPGQVRPPCCGATTRPSVRLSINIDVLSNTATSVAPTSSYHWNTSTQREFEGDVVALTSAASGMHWLCTLPAI
jgi:hypothetical protein